MPDVVIYCCLLHNLLFGQSPKVVEHLLDVLRQEGMVPEVMDNNVNVKDRGGMPAIGYDPPKEKRQALEMFLAWQWNLDIHD